MSISDEGLPSFSEAEFTREKNKRFRGQGQSTLQFQRESSSGAGPSLASVLNRPIPLSKCSNISHFVMGRASWKNPYETSSDEYDDEGGDGSSEDEAKRYLLKKAIGIDPDAIQKYDLESTPENGSQYLLAVRNHNRKVPKVVRADPQLLEKKIRRKEMLEKASAAPETEEKCNSSTSSSELGSKDDIVIVENQTDTQPECFISELEYYSSRTADVVWESRVMHDFTRLREKINRFRKMIDDQRIIVALPSDVKLPDLNHNIWQRFCLGIYLSNKFNATPKCFPPHVDLNSFFEDFVSQKPETLESEESAAEDFEKLNITESESPPNSDALTDLNNHVLGKTAHPPLLSILLNIDQRTLEWLIKTHLNWFKSHGLIHVYQAKWIYALFACVQEPLEPTVISDIREFAKKSICVREKLIKLIHKQPIEAVNLKHFENYVTSLNLIICLVSKYFGQRDLTENF